ncbi:MAG: TetR/AcrR family transcriptional regulator, partial [Pseudomonadota bacterium]
MMAYLCLKAETKTPMARPRTFNEDEVIQRAMVAFWKDGYEGTSVGKLEQATGISRISLYNAFGDKTQLFLKALRLYSKSSSTYFENEEFVSGGLSAIIGLFEGTDTQSDDQAPERFGCLMLNTILDLETAGRDAKQIIADTRERMINGFEKNMHRAIDSGEMQGVPPTEIRERAEFLVGALWGGRMAVRLHGDICQARGTAATVARIVKTW